MATIAQEYVQQGIEKLTVLFSIDVVSPITGLMMDEVKALQEVE